MLASSSPRRIEILKKLKFNFVSVNHKFDENSLKNNPEKNNPFDLVKNMAYNKALSVKNDFKNDCVLGCDTVVIIDNLILGKPENKNQAMDFLNLLSAREHTVSSGYSLIYKEKIITGCVNTYIKVKPLSIDDVKYYVNNENVLDAAGGYKIQGIFSLFIEEIKGSWYNVVGLPVAEIYEKLKVINQTD